jgi:hypothetical protein
MEQPPVPSRSGLPAEPERGQILPIPAELRPELFAQKFRIRSSKGVIGWGAAFLACSKLGSTLLQLNEFLAADICFAIATVSGLVFVRSARISKLWRVLGCVVALGIFSLICVDVYKMKGDKQWTNFFGTPRPGFNNNLRVTSMERHPYVAGQPLSMNIYFHYDGDAPAIYKIRGEIITITEFGGKYATPEGMTQFEDRQWDEMVVAAKRRDLQDNGSSIAPKASQWRTVPAPESNTPVLTIDEASKLNSGVGSALMVMGYIKWTEGDDKTEYEYDYCEFTQTTVYALCKNHNGPVKVRR